MLELDHVRGQKLADISQLMNAAPSKIISELEKCEPRCANCHRRVTAFRRTHPVEKRPR